MAHTEGLTIFLRVNSTRAAGKSGAKNRPTDRLLWCSIFEHRTELNSLNFADFLVSANRQLLLVDRRNLTD